MSRILIGCFFVVLLQSIASQTVDDTCSNLDVENMSADQLINDAPPDWNFDCLNKRLISETISNEAHVKGVIDCLHPETPICVKEGYRVIAEEIFRRADGSGRCTNCSPKTAALVDYGLRLMQQRHPRELRRGLSFLG